MTALVTHVIFAWTFLACLAVGSPPLTITTQVLYDYNTTCGNGVVASGICQNSSQCCSPYGVCGTEKECGNGCLSGPCLPCGGGIIGNGTCADNSCCSNDGYCGNTILHCGAGKCAAGCNATLTSTPCGNGTVGNGTCISYVASRDPFQCCSQHGYCGKSADYCGNDCLGGPCLPCGNGIRGTGVCANSTTCCSRTGYCTAEACTSPCASLNGPGASRINLQTPSQCYSSLTRPNPTYNYRTTGFVGPCPPFPNCDPGRTSPPCLAGQPRASDCVPCATGFFKTWTDGSPCMPCIDPTTCILGRTALGNCTPTSNFICINITQREKFDPDRVPES